MESQHNEAPPYAAKVWVEYEFDPEGHDYWTPEDRASMSEAINWTHARSLDVRSEVEARRVMGVMGRFMESIDEIGAVLSRYQSLGERIDQARERELADIDEARTDVLEELYDVLSAVWGTS